MSRYWSLHVSATCRVRFLKMQKFDRRTLIRMVAAAAATAFATLASAQKTAPEAPLGFTADPKLVERARLLLARHPAIDLHAHPGVTFVRAATDVTPEARAIVSTTPFERQAVTDMEAGNMAGGSFAAVADMEILGVRDGKLGSVREFRAGEARTSYEKQIASLREWVPKAGAVLAMTPEDIVRLHHERKIAALLTVEGGDFLAGDTSNVKKAFADGVRMITLVHYHPNELGDIQTAAPRSGGLTAFGRNVVGEMDRLGMLIDVAHASEDTVRGVLKATRNPVICSHTALAGHPSAFPRFISDGLAREIAAQGGIIGAWPAGLGATTLNDYIERIFELRRAVGPDHVALGTDMDANYRPVLSNYRQMPVLVSELLRRNYGTDEVIAFLGGNFLRVFKQVWSRRKS
jgi:membrane dipeptidase